MKGYQALPEERCGNCEYFCQYYGHEEWGAYFLLRFGHCTHPRLEKRRAEEHCPHWTPSREPGDPA